MAITNNIIQGDNNVILFFNIADTEGNTGVLDGVSTIQCKIMIGTTSITKTCNIVDAQIGRCSVALSSTDIASVGRYNFQLTLTYTNGNKFTTNVSKFNVDKRL